MFRAGMVAAGRVTGTPEQPVQQQGREPPGLAHQRFLLPVVLAVSLGPVDKPVLAPVQPERLGRCNTDVAAG